MATVNFIPCERQCVSSMKNTLEYVLQDIKVCIDCEKHNVDHTESYKTYSEDADKSNSIRLISGKDCCPETAVMEFMATKNSFKKANDVMFYQYTQSFKDGEAISPKAAHEIAIKFAEDNYPDFEVVIATHVDNEHLHSHFIINSVSFKTGKKLHDGPNTLLKLRKYSDQICQQYGLTTLTPYLGGKSQNPGAREYRSAAKGESWKFALMSSIDDCMKRAPTKQAFIEMMGRKGYSVKWMDTRKSITYDCPNKMSCRDFKLHDPRYLKERMEHEFELRRIETAKLRLVAGESVTGAPADSAADTQPLPTDTTGCGRDIRDFDKSAGADKSITPTSEQPQATERIATHQAESATDQGGVAVDTASGKGDGADALTGWETEREILFHPEMALAEDISQPDVVAAAPNIGGVVGSVVQLGKAVERLGNDVPVKDATAKLPGHNGKKKKLAVGQKEDDHSGYDFTMTM